MSFLKPRIYGLRKAAGIVLWVPTAFLLVASVLNIVASILSPFPDLIAALGLALAAAAMLALTMGFWRGSNAARWLAILPGFGFFLAAIGWWLLSGICVAGAPMPSADPSPVLALSCVDPLPPRSLLSWIGTAVLAGSGGLVLVGVFRPGRIEDDRPEPGGDHA